MQDADRVRSTKDLDNKFTLVAALHFDSIRSNSTVKVYNCSGSHISLDDYNSDHKIDQCIALGCEYALSLMLKMQGTSGSL